MTNDFKNCPYCSSTNIGHNQGLWYLNPEAGVGYTNEWYCKYCGEVWGEQDDPKTS